MFQMKAGDSVGAGVAVGGIVGVGGRVSVGIGVKVGVVDGVCVGVGVSVFVGVGVGVWVSVGVEVGGIMKAIAVSHPPGLPHKNQLPLARQSSSKKGRSSQPIFKRDFAGGGSLGATASGRMIVAQVGQRTQAG